MSKVKVQVCAALTQAREKPRLPANKSKMPGPESKASSRLAKQSETTNCSLPKESNSSLTFGLIPFCTGKELTAGQVSTESGAVTEGAGS